MTKISENDLILISIVTCINSIRTNHNNVSKAQWNKLSQIYEQLVKLQQDIVYRPHNKRYDADAVVKELISVQPMSPKLGKHFKNSFDVVFGKGWEKKIKEGKPLSIKNVGVSKVTGKKLYRCTCSHCECERKKRSK